MQPSERSLSSRRRPDPTGNGRLDELLVDTDIFIDHLRGHRRFIPGEDRIFYSVLTRAELFAGRGSEEGPIVLVLGPFSEIPIDRAIAEAGGRLRRDHSLSLPDALIAATA